MPSIFITRPLPDAGIKLLQQAGYQVDVYAKDQAIPRKELLKAVKGRDAVLTLLTDKVDEEFFQAAGPQLKIVANYAVGFDNVDLEAAKNHHVAATNTPCDEVTEAVAEHTFTFIMALAHRIVEGDVYCRAKKYQGWSPNLLLGNDVYGKTLGIIGAGRIGAAVLRRAVNGFGMQCVYSDVHPNTELEKDFGARFLPLDELLQVSDFVSLHVPLLPSTRHLISTEQFALMKKTAYLVNTARGPIVDEKALLRAIYTQRIAGAALDVFECEPAIDCDLTDKLELKACGNVIMTPHIASGTVESRQAMSRVAAENILAVLSGKPALNPAK